MSRVIDVSPDIALMCQGMIGRGYLLRRCPLHVHRVRCHCPPGPGVEKRQHRGYLVGLVPHRDPTWKGCLPRRRLERGAAESGPGAFLPIAMTLSSIRLGPQMKKNGIKIPSTSKGLNRGWASRPKGTRDRCGKGSTYQTGQCAVLAIANGTGELWSRECRSGLRCCTEDLPLQSSGVPAPA